MSDSIGRVDLDLGINSGTFNRELSGIAGNAESMVGGAFRGLGKTIAAAFAVKELFDFGKGAVELASNLNEVQNVVDVTFGSMANQVDSFAKSALSSFGLSELSAKKFTSTIGAMLKSSGLAGQQMVNMSEGITSLAADMASFYNLNQQDAFDKIRSGISGEVEPLRQVGINMSQANLQAYALSKGIKGNITDMSQAQQTLIRYNYLMSVTSDAQGDFARTSSSWANQTRLLSEEFKQFQGILGAGFINLLTPILGVLNAIIQKLTIAAQYFKAFTELITGQKAAVSATTTATVGMGSATTDAGKAVTKAGKAVKGSLSNFDQLNVIAQSTSDAMDGIGDSAGGVGAIDLGTAAPVDLGIDPSSLAPFQQALETIRDIAADIGNYFLTIFGDPLQQAVTGGEAILNGFAQYWQQNQGLIKEVVFSTLQSIGSYYTTVFTAISTYMSGVFTTLGNLWKQYGTSIIAGLTNDMTVVSGVISVACDAMGHIIQGLSDTALKIFNDLAVAVAPIIAWFVTDGVPLIASFVTDAIKILRTYFDAAKEIFDTLLQGVIAPAMALVSQIIVDCLSSIKTFWDNWGTQLTDGLTTWINNVKDIFMTLWKYYLEPIVTNLLKVLKDLWDKHLKDVVAEFLDFVGKLYTAALGIYNNVIAPVVEWLTKTFGPAFANSFNFIVNIIGDAVGAIADIIKGLFKILGGIIDFLTGVFTGDWAKAWTGLKEVFGGIVDMIVGIFKGAINIIIDAINFLIGAIDTIHFEIPDWVPIVGGKSFGISIPKVPKLANGGLVSGPTLALVGDNKGAASGDPEVVSPLSKLQDMMGGGNQILVEVLLQILEAIKNQNMSVDLDGEKLSRVLRGYNTAENNRLGKKMVTVGGVFVG